jgi:hypothetical protein
MEITKVQQAMENLLPNLRRLKATKPRIYEQRLALYRELMDGGDGGSTPDGKTFRELHFADWTSRDFAIMLHELDEDVEIPPAPEVVSSEEPSKKSSWLGKLFGPLSGNK